MDEEIKHIIAGMSGVELAMLEDRGLDLPTHLHAKAEQYRRGERACETGSQYRARRTREVAEEIRDMWEAKARRSHDRKVAA